MCAAAIPLSACASDQSMPLVFGRTQTIGIGVQGSAADGGASITLGFNDRNIAVVPTTASDGDRVRSMATDDGQKETLPFEDALSVLGQFEANADARAGDVGTALGTFFSTGTAARYLAQGFSARLAAGKPTTQTDVENAAADASTIVRNGVGGAVAPVANTLTDHSGAQPGAGGATNTAASPEKPVVPPVEGSGTLVPGQPTDETGEEREENSAAEGEGELQQAAAASVRRTRMGTVLTEMTGSPSDLARMARRRGERGE